MDCYGKKENERTDAENKLFTFDMVMNTKFAMKMMVGDLLSMVDNKEEKMEFFARQMMAGKILGFSTPTTPGEFGIICEAVDNSVYSPVQFAKDFLADYDKFSNEMDTVLKAPLN